MKLSARALFGHPILVLFALLAMSQPGLMGQVQTIGSWSTASYTMPINPIHVALLYNGKILVVAGSGNCPPSLGGCPAGVPYGPSNGSGALLVDPTSGSITQFSVSWDMFCNGMVVLPDGRAFINGGTIAYDPFEGSPKSSIFDPQTNAFTNVPNMAHGRWYPTVLTLGDGRIMTFSGFLETGETTNTTVEFYTPNSGTGSWSQAYTAPFTPDLYPRMHLLPNGKVFVSGAPPVSELFDPSSTTWTLNVASTNYGGTREYGSSVLLGLTPANNYDPVVLILGGDSPATKTTETIDLGSSNPKWKTGPNMSQARIEMNAVILPNGKVLAVGGSVNDEDAGSKSLNADLYDPASNTISSAGANAYARLYHSVALLLPDATVWVAGGNPTRGSYEPHVEIYKPAYLYQSNGSLATRPTISSAPASISYGNPFTVSTPDAASIASAVLVRNGTVTHAFGMDQRMVGMSFTAGSGSLSITAPSNGNIAPPGYYMLFLLNSAGVPSVAKFVQVTSAGSSGPPSGISFVQAGTGPSTVQSSNSSVAVSFPSAQVAGDLNVVAVGWGDTSSAVSSVSDSRGNVYTRAVGPATTTGLSQSLYYAKNIAAGSNTVTVTFNQAAAYPDV
ncbi:MAG: galactose oxidase-like domain-containing protein, partial [Terriglobales bacterium]